MIVNKITVPDDLPVMVVEDGETILTLQTLHQHQMAAGVVIVMALATAGTITPAVLADTITPAMGGMDNHKRLHLTVVMVVHPMVEEATAVVARAVDFQINLEAI